MGAMSKKRRAPSLLAAALLLPLTPPAQAASPPERAQLSFKYLDYFDYQADQDRIRVKTPALLFLTPLSESWAVNASYVSDSISGASPRYYTYDSRGSFSNLTDLRRAVDVGISKYFPRGSLTLGANYSHESDYLSRGFSVQGTLASDDNNTTLNLGISVSNDRINPSNEIVIDARKHVTDWIVGLTQVLTPQDIVQMNLGYSVGNGYFDDPYKAFDVRPDHKERGTVLVKWNHHFSSLNLTSHASYRFYSDTFGIDAHTLQLELVQPWSDGWSFSPLLRLYAQTAADFYVEAQPGDKPNITFPDAEARYSSLDQRLSGFGAVTYGFKLSKQAGKDWLFDFKYEHYQQDTGWNFAGDASQGLDPFKARSVQIGITRYF